MDILPIHDRADNATRGSPVYEISQIAKRKTVEVLESLQQTQTHKTTQKNLLAAIDLDIT